MLNHMIVKNDPNTTDEGEGIQGREMEHAVDIYPFDDGKPGQAFYPGNVPYPDRRSVSAKYAFEAGKPGRAFYPGNVPYPDRRSVSAKYAFDDGKPGRAFYPGNVPYPDRRSVSAKYAFDDGKPGRAFYPGNVPYPDRRSVSAKYAPLTTANQAKPFTQATFSTQAGQATSLTQTAVGMTGDMYANIILLQISTITESVIELSKLD
ncbi:hypothetical protein N0V93_010280 [Gnomoniopsis smithogilvyi]|uniref:Uncharacterized protein n=1 Tax=Gnomoniopsis smithogilvyi TaxID=1191159 RepID=A0A9W8YHJ6_9PEZI|nr:hypothetical protein N0V93_010280 [Gnomoniopsis smithogilvyi]